jgi:formate--tetrahydrofolate ligase
MEVAAGIGLGPDLAEPYGRHRAKISLDALAPSSGKRAHGPSGPLSGKLGPSGPLSGKRGRYVLVSAVTPTAAGEGKTVTSIGLTMGLATLGHRAAASLRQSSLGPTFGGKGGGAGGGKAIIAPLDECLLGLGDDLFAVESANNLLAAVVDDHVHRNGSPAIDARSITWRRAVDVDDRALRRVVTGLGGTIDGVPRETGFDITAASEVMAILGLSSDLADLRRRLAEIVVGFGRDGMPVKASSLHVVGAMVALLQRALQPNLMQTAEGDPIFVHTGPFANIAHGNSSVVSDLIALPRVDYLVTEAGFATELGAEKFFHLKCAATGLAPDASVCVVTARALKSHVPGAPLDSEDVDALRVGAANLRAHVANLRQFGAPVVVAVNRFPSDTPAELAALREEALAAGAVAVAAHDAFGQGGVGATELAQAVVDACDASTPGPVLRLYDLDDDPVDKVRKVATTLYGAADVQWEPSASRALARFVNAGYGRLPICIAKTNLALSHDPTHRGAPTGYTFPVREVRLAAGAGFLTVLAGSIVTMPGLPPGSRYAGIDVGEDGQVVGLR